MCTSGERAGFRLLRPPAARLLGQAGARISSRIWPESRPGRSRLSEVPETKTLSNEDLFLSIIRGLENTAFFKRADAAKKAAIAEAVASMRRAGLRARRPAPPGETGRHAEAG